MPTPLSTRPIGRTTTFARVQRVRALRATVDRLLARVHDLQRRSDHLARSLKRF
jgi:hypothetical protein